MSNLTHDRINEIASAIALQPWQRSELHRHLQEHVQDPGEIRAAAENRIKRVEAAAESDPARRAAPPMREEGQVWRIHRRPKSPYLPKLVLGTYVLDVIISIFEGHLLAGIKDGRTKA